MTDFKLSPDIATFLEKPSSIAFLKAARAFVASLEIEEIASDVFYKKAHRALAGLCASGFDLEEIPQLHSTDAGEFNREELFENKNAGKIGELGKDSFYWEVFDPVYENEAEPSHGWLVDDFSDIYQDWKIELAKIDNIGSVGHLRCTVGIEMELSQSLGTALHLCIEGAALFGLWR